MKIVLIGGQSIPGIGGIESYMLNLASSLTKLGNEVTLICSSREAYTSDYNGIKIIHKVCPKSNVIAFPLLFLKSLGYILKNRKNIDVVNFKSIFFAFIPGWIASLCGCKVYYTIHSLAEDNPKHKWFAKVMMKICAFISIYACGKNIITVSNSKAADIKKRYGKKCSVIPCGVSQPMPNPSSKILTKYGIIPNRYYLTIGRIDPIKNLDILIKAFIKRGNSDFQLVLAGDYSNNYGQELLKMCSEQQNILFVGSVMGEDKEYLLKHSFANCLVSSSEGMPLSLLEAMSYGKPCIVTDIPAIREIMKDHWGQWCPVQDIDSIADKMATIESDQGSMNKIGGEIQSYIIENQTWDNIAHKYIKHIQSI
jgi:glycosyltransferase involved in cell wall biosynthesis